MKSKEFFIFFLFFLLTIFYFFKPLTEGKILAPGDGKSFFLPLKEYFSKNEISFWFPYEFLGLPYVSILQTAFFYPFNFLYKVFPLPFTYNLLFLLHLSSASFFTFLYLKEIGSKKISSVFSGIVFSLSGFLIAHKGHLTILNASIYLPLILYLNERLKKTLGFKYSILSSIAISLQIFAGHFQISFYSNLLLFFYIIYNFFQITKEKRLKFLIFSFLPFFFSLLITSPQIFSTYEIIKQSPRQSWDFFEFTSYSFEPYMIIQAIFPFIFGTEYGGKYWASWNITEMNIFIGILPLILSISVIYKKKEKKIINFWLLILIVSLFLAIGKYNAIYKILYNIPLLNLFRVPARHIFEFHFSIAVLAGIAFDYLEKKEFLKKFLKNLIFLFLFILIFSLVLKSFLSSEKNIQIFNESSKKMLLKSFTLKNKAFKVPIIFLTLYLILAFLKLNFEKKFLEHLLILTFFFEAFSFGNYHDSNYPSKEYMEIFKEKKAIIFLRENLKNERILTFERDLSNIKYVPLKIRKLNGYDPFILKDFETLTGLKAGGECLDQSNLILNNKFLSTLNLKYILKEKNINLDFKIINPKIKIEIPLGKTFEGEIKLKAKSRNLPAKIETKVNLKKNNFYIFQFEGKANEKVLKGVSMDLYGGQSYDSGEQELYVEPAELGKNFRFYSKLINTKDIPEETYLRLFSFSMKEIILKNIKLFEVIDYSIEEPYLKVFEDGEFEIYENKNVLEKLFSVENLKAVKDIYEIKSFFKEENFDPEREGLIFEKDLKEIKKTDFEKAKINLIEIKNDKIKFETISKGESFIIFSEQFYPGWRCKINGEKTKIFKTNGVLIGFIVPPGKNLVELKFFPDSIFFPLLFFSLPLILFFLLYFIAWKKE